jgi:hypothetical protein
MSGLRSKQHSITVQLVSQSGGVENQNITITESTDSPDILTSMNFEIVDAIQGVMRKYARAGSFPTSVEELQQKFNSVNQVGD